MQTTILQSNILSWQCGVVLDSLLLLFLVGLIWLGIRRVVSPQWGIALFLLVMIKAIVPLSVSVPAAVGNLSMSQFLQRQVTATPESESPAASPQPLPQSIVDATNNDHVITTDEHSPFPHEEETASFVPHVGAKNLLPLLEPGDPPVEALRATPRQEPGDPPVGAKNLLPLQEPGNPPVGALRATPQRVTTLLLVAWLTIVALLTARGLTRQIRFHRLLRRARCIAPELLPLDFEGLCRSLGIQRPVPVYELSEIASPAVYGLFRPKILLPQHLLATTNEEEIRWILLHELAHVRRFDVWCHLFTRIVCVLFFFNPAVWVSGRMIQRLREYACDDFATYYSHLSPIQASEAFMKILRYHSRNRAGAVPALAIINDSRNQAFTRMQRILDTERPLHVRFGLRSFCLWMLLGALVLPRFVASEKAVGEVVPQPTAVAGVFDSQTGTVIDKQGKPVAGAEVELLLDDTVLKTTSAADGTYRLPITREQLLSANSATFRATATIGTATMIGIDTSYDGRETPLIDAVGHVINIVLHPTYRTEITVRDSEGNPIEGAIIEALIEFEQGFPAPFAGPNTDANGRSFVVIPENVRIRDVWTKKDGLGLDYLHNTAPPDPLDLREERYRIAERLPEKIEFTLRGADRHIVHVYDAASKPVNDSRERNNVERPDHPAPDNPPPPALAPTTGKVDVAAFEAAYIAERVKRAYELSGTILDSQGNPAKGATMVLREYGGNAVTDPKYISPPVKTNEQGQFRISTSQVEEDFFGNCLFFLRP